MANDKAVIEVVGMKGYDEGFVEHEFVRAARAVGVKVLPRLQAPMEIRKEGTLTAVSRLLDYPGEETGKPFWPNGIAPGIYEQFKRQFEASGVDKVAFHSAEEHKTYNLETEKYEIRWSFRYAYLKG